MWISSQAVEWSLPPTFSRTHNRSGRTIGVSYRAGRSQAAVDKCLDNGGQYLANDESVPVPGRLEAVTQAVDLDDSSLVS